MVGFLATAVALTIGVIWGLVSGYMGGLIDNIMMRTVDILYAIPFAIFIILLMVVFGRNIYLLFLAIGLLSGQQWHELYAARFSVSVTKNI